MKTRITNLIPFLKKKTVEPVIYALVLKSDYGEKLHLGVYYSYDEALDKAIDGANESGNFKGKDLKWSVKMWLSIDVRDIMDECCETEIDVKNNTIKETLKDTLDKIEELDNQ